MSDLTEFLLARIAEDETALIEYCRGAAIPVTLATATHRVLKVDDDLAARVLAECEAKRQSVQLINEVRENFRRDGYGDCPLILYQLLQTMVQPYAGHPDFRPEWRLP